MNIAMRSTSWLRSCSHNLLNVTGIRLHSSDTIIEIERKFQVTEANLKEVHKHATGLSDTKEMIDTYFDVTSFSHPPFPLTTHDMWLRNRTWVNMYENNNYVFELKWPQNKLDSTSEGGKLKGIDEHFESTSWPVIAEILQLPPFPLPSETESEKVVESWLNMNHIHRFATFKTRRERFQLQLPIGKIGLKWITGKKKSYDSIERQELGLGLENSLIYYS
jgi:uncharacterized protein YjbK